MPEEMLDAPQLEKHHQLPLYFALIAVIAALVGAAGTFYYFNNQKSTIESQYAAEKNQLESDHIEQVKMLQGQLDEKEQRLTNAYEAPTNLQPIDVTQFVYGWRYLRLMTNNLLPAWDENENYLTQNFLNALRVEPAAPQLDENGNIAFQGGIDKYFCSGGDASPLYSINVINQGASAAQIAIRLPGTITTEVPIVVNLVNEQSTWKIDSITCPPEPQPDEVAAAQEDSAE